MGCLISSSCGMHKSFPPTENPTRLVCHCELKAALVLFPVTKQETWSLACDWKCSEQTLPIPATSDQTQSSAHALTVQTPCVALYARGLRAEDVTRLRQSLIPWGNPKSRGSYISVLSAGQTIISWVWFSSQFDSASPPQTCPLINQTSPGVTARGRRLRRWKLERRKYLPPGAQRWALYQRAPRMHDLSRRESLPQAEERGENCRSFAGSSPVVIARTILDLIDLLIPWPSLWVQLCVDVIGPSNPEMDFSLGPAVSQLPFPWLRVVCKIQQIREKANFPMDRTGRFMQHLLVANDTQSCKKTGRSCNLLFQHLPPYSQTYNACL